MYGSTPSPSGGGGGGGVNWCGRVGVEGEDWQLCTAGANPNDIPLCASLHPSEVFRPQKKYGPTCLVRSDLQGIVGTGKSVMCAFLKHWLATQQSVCVFLSSQNNSRSLQAVANFQDTSKGLGKGPGEECQASKVFTSGGTWQEDHVTTIYGNHGPALNRVARLRSTPFVRTERATKKANRSCGHLPY